MQKGASFFIACGVVAGKDGLWLHKQVLILAKNNNTPLSEWLSMTLRELRFWIKANNAVIEEERGEADGK